MIFLYPIDLSVLWIGTEEFDVTTIDFSTIKLEGISPIPSDLADVATPHDDKECIYNELADYGYYDIGPV